MEILVIEDERRWHGDERVNRMNKRLMLRVQITFHIAPTSMLLRVYGVQKSPADAQEVPLERV